MILLLLSLLFASAFFSSSETALFSLSTHKIKSLTKSEERNKRLIYELLRRPRDLLVTVFMWNTLVNILLQNVSSSLFGEAAGWGLKVGVPLLLTLIFGEVIPKNYGLENNFQLASAVSPLIHYFHILSAPIRKAVVAITTPISKGLFFFLKKEEKISADELFHVLATSEKEGVLSPSQAALVRGYLKLQNIPIRELMQPRREILFYNTKEPLSTLHTLFKEQEYSRVPVCDGSLHKVLGILTARQFLLNQQAIIRSQTLIPYLEKPLFVPETTPARLLLRRFDQTGEMVALVVDEYGAVSGLVTRSDLFETVIGKMADKRSHKPLYTHAGQNALIASGKLELDTFNTLFHSTLKSAHGNKTLGGWLIETLGRIPQNGEKIEQNGFLFHVLSSTPSRIRRLYIRRGK